MKKTILAIAIPALFASAAQAATIYDKNGTSVDITGNLRSQFVSQFDKADGSRSDSDLKGRARLGFSGKTAINDTWSAIAKGEWQYTSQTSDNGDLDARDVYVGVDGSQFGQLRFGQLDTVYNDVIGKADIAQENSGAASGYDGRQEGQVRYDGAWNGVSVGGSYFTGRKEYNNDNNWGAGNFKYGADLVRGYAGKVGYTAPFGLALVVGGEHKDFQETTFNKFEKKNDMGVGASYTLNGLYLGAQYNKTKLTKFVGDDTKYRGYELAASYTTDAWTPYVIYDNAKEQGAEHLSVFTTMGLSYQFTSNFNAYGEYVVDNTEADNKYLLGLLYAF